MKFDLKRPCQYCPFANTPTRITFACRERAEEIEESAYRNGFVCHEHGESIEGDDQGSYIDFRADGSSQHCVGALMMYLEHGGNVPFQRACEDNPELEDYVWSRIDTAAMQTVFEDEQAFIEANT